MAGTVHEVENHALLAEVEREAANAAQELVSGNNAEHIVYQFKIFNV